MASMLTTAPSRLRPAASFSSNTGMAVVSLVLSSTASCPRTRRLLVAKAETRCSAARPLARSWLRLTVLPSMAIASRGSGQQARTQSMKQAANRSGSIRFIMMLSQRPEGIPQLNGRNRRKNSRWPFPQSETASKLSHSAIVAQTHTSNTSFRTSLVLDPGKMLQQKPQSGGSCGFHKARRPRGRLRIRSAHRFASAAIRKCR
jgi:hypothetical protein